MGSKSRKPRKPTVMNGRNPEGLIEEKIGKKVDREVGKGEQAKHAPETNQVGKIQKLAERRDGKSDDEKTQRPIPGRELNELHGIRAESVVEAAPDQRP